MKKTKLEATRIYVAENKLEDLLLDIIEKELENLFNDMYNQSQADTVINQNERLVA